MPADPIQHAWVFQLVTVVFMLATPFLAWWGSSRYFAGQWEAHLKNQEQWREGIGKRLDKIDLSIETVSWPAMMVRLSRAEQDILELRRFKHEKVEPYIRALDVQRSEIDQMQKAITRRPGMRTRADD